MRKYVIMLVLLAVAEIGLSLYLTDWRHVFWDAVVAKDSEVFIKQLGIFALVALTLCFITGYSGYLVTKTAIKYREKLNAKALALKDTKAENMNQRIQADCMEYPDLLLNLGYGLVKAVCYVAVFAASLWLGFAWYYLAILVVYGIAGTYLTKKIALPLVSLNYQTQRAEATYRNELHDMNFTECIKLMYNVAIKQKYLSYFQSFYGQVGVIVPLVLIAPAYFAGGMTVGSLMQFNSLSATVLDNLSFGVNSFGIFNRLLSCRRRLKEVAVL